MKEKRSWPLRAVAALLSMILLTQILPMSVMAAEVRQNAAEKAEQEAVSGYSTNVSQQEAEPTVVAEDREKREANVRHFVMSDGTRNAVVYPEAVHFQDEAGEWRDIDNTLKLDLSRSGEFAGYETQENAFQVRFAKSMGQGTTFRISEDGYALSWKYETPQSKLRSALSLAQPVEGETGADNPFALPKVNQTLVYKNAAPGTDFSYTVSGGGVKENIIVNEPQDVYEYSFIAGSRRT